MNAKPNPLTVVLVSAIPATIEAVRRACFDDGGDALQFTAAAD